MPSRERTALLLIDPPAEGAWNMAADEVLLASAAARGQRCLRFYGWQRSTLSLGYFQRLEQREQHPPSRDCAVVRRATGGGAILHDQELTYSFTAPAGDRWAADVNELYDAFHESLIETLSEWGVVARQVEKAEVPRSGEPFLCFQRRARGDVLVRDYKIGGSAQRRQHGAVLQHGSILLQASTSAPELPGIGELAGVGLTPRALREAWAPRLAERLGIQLVDAGWGDADWRAVEQLVEGRYAHASWTTRR